MTMSQYIVAKEKANHIIRLYKDSNGMMLTTAFSTY